MNEYYYLFGINMNMNRYMNYLFEMSGKRRCVQLDGICMFWVNRH